MFPVAVAARRSDREDALVDAARTIVFGTGHSRLVLPTHLWLCDTLTRGSFTYGTWREARQFLFECLLEELRVGCNKTVKRLGSPCDSKLGGREASDLCQKLIAQCR